MHVINCWDTINKEYSLEIIAICCELYWKEIFSLSLFARVIYGLGYIYLGEEDEDEGEEEEEEEIKLYVFFSSSSLDYNVRGEEC